MIRVFAGEGFQMDCGDSSVIVILLISIPSILVDPLPRWIYIGRSYDSQSVVWTFWSAFSLGSVFNVNLLFKVSTTEQLSFCADFDQMNLAMILKCCAGK